MDFEIARQKLREEVRARMDGLTEDALDLSARRLDGDVALRDAIPPAVLGAHRALLDERDVRGAAHAGVRERLLPLEHSAINDVESSVAQKTIRNQLSRSGGGETDAELEQGDREAVRPGQGGRRQRA